MMFGFPFHKSVANCCKEFRICNFRVLVTDSVTNCYGFQARFLENKTPTQKSITLGLWRKQKAIRSCCQNLESRKNKFCRSCPACTRNFVEKSVTITILVPVPGSATHFLRKSCTGQTGSLAAQNVMFLSRAHHFFVKIQIDTFFRNFGEKSVTNP